MPCVLQALEKLLPPREKVDIPMGDHVEEVQLMEFDPRAQGHGSRRQEAYDDDDDDDDSRGPGVQCAHQ